MTLYRLLERSKPGYAWQTHGVAYTEEGMCLFYRLSQKFPVQLQVASLVELGDKHFPDEKDGAFRWGAICEWNKEEPFSPARLLQPLAQPHQRDKHRPRYRSLDEMPLEMRKLLLDINLLWTSEQEAQFKEEFVALQENNIPLYRQLVEALWHRWAILYKDVPPFPDPKYNVALLLYARVFGLPVSEYSGQVEYLAQHVSLYGPLAPPPGQWGARASLSRNISAMIDSPVIHAWSYEEGDIKRILIVGKGLASHRDQIFFDALVTAMRVRASSEDIFSDGLISIERDPISDASLEIQLPVWGANAPLRDPEDASAAMRDLIRQLEKMDADTGFVQVHKEANAEIATIYPTLRHWATEAAISGDEILWTPTRDMMSTDKESVTIEPIFKFPSISYSASPRNRISPLELALSPHLLGADSWQRLISAYEELIIGRIQMDAQIRLEYYQRRADGLREEKKQWDKSDEQQRLQRWGPTVTLNQLFDDALGLAIWLREPTIKPTKQYYEESVPGLIQSYETWAAKMERILNSLRDAKQRQDLPFRRLMTARCFDAALRGRDLGETPRIQELYREWAATTGDLLRFEWRQKLLSEQANSEDLFTIHTTFNLRQYTNEQGTLIVRLGMIPYTLFDAKRSVALFDPRRRIMVVNDASDYPQPGAPPLSSIDIQQAIKQHLHGQSPDKIAPSSLTQFLQEWLIQSPRQVSQQIISLLGPQSTDRALRADSDQVLELYQHGALNASFSRLIDLADTATGNRALLTARESLEAARLRLPDIVKRWREKQNPTSEAILPEPQEFECRLYLWIAIAECLATGYVAKDHLPTIYRTPHAGGKPEIRDALAMADNTDPKYTREWVEYLTQWDLHEAYNKLKWGLPTEKSIISSEEDSTIRAFDALELMHLVANLREAMTQLSHAQEPIAAALVKLGPALESALCSYAANIVYGDLMYILERLTGREAPFSRGM
jgi:hypothetical protein